jgi:ferredoxin--NADP+ reductase
VSPPVELGRPLRVAVVGAGPAGFYTVEALLKHREVEVEVDLLERLPAPYGLLRYGVAPDHPKIKGVSIAYERLCDDPRVRFLGNVTVGSEHVSIDDLAHCYDQVVVATGCETDRRLGIPGEDLAGSHSATSFVAWYNGHPDYADLSFDLSTERAVVVGIGDVAMDLARILLRDPGHADLATSDITSYALEELRRSRIREVVILARRGPAEAAFAAKELEDVSELPGVAVDVDGPIVAQALAAVDPHAGHEKHKLEVLARLAETGRRGADKRLAIRFLSSPVAIEGDAGRAKAVRVEKNELVADAGGERKARGTGEHETIDAGLVLRSIGYLGVPIEGRRSTKGAGSCRTSKAGSSTPAARRRVSTSQAGSSAARAGSSAPTRATPRPRCCACSKTCRRSIFAAGPTFRARPSTICSNGAASRSCTGTAGSASMSAKSSAAWRSARSARSSPAFASSSTPRRRTSRLARRVPVA